MSGFGCDNVPFSVIPIILINIVFSVINLVLFLRGCIFFWDNQNIKNNVKISCFSTLLCLFLTSIGCSLTILMFFICPINRNNEYQLYFDVSVPIVLSGTGLSLILIQMLFTFRVINVFKSSALEVSNMLKRTLYSLSLFECITFCIWNISNVLFIATGEKNSFYQTLRILNFGILVILYFIQFIVLGYNFIKKLKHFAVVVCSSDVSLQKKISSLIYKLFLCWLLSFSSTFLNYGFIILYSAIVDYYVKSKISEYIIVPLVFSMFNIDTLMNNIGLVMQFEFGEKLYKKLCTTCDNRLKKKCKIPNIFDENNVNINNINNINNDNNPGLHSHSFSKL